MEVLLLYLLLQLAFHYYQRELFPEQKAPLQIKASAICLYYGRKGESNFCKDCLRKEHSLSYDALTAHVAIVLTRYMLIAMEQRQKEGQRTLGELFFFLVDEMDEITFSISLGIMMDTLMASLQVILKLSDEQLTAFTADFEARLP